MTPNILTAAQRIVTAEPDLARLRKATDAFETAFVKQLVTEMRKAGQNEFKDVPGSGIYDDMTNQVLAEKLSAKGAFGVSDAMYKQLSKLVLDQSGQAQPVKKT
ncbi:MAG: rod-binding protein [Fimbriimonadaceae bacterium]